MNEKKKNVCVRVYVLLLIRNRQPVRPKTDCLVVFEATEDVTVLWVPAAEARLVVHFAFCTIGSLCAVNL